MLTYRVVVKAHVLSKLGDSNRSRSRCDVTKQPIAGWISKRPSLVLQLFIHHCPSLAIHVFLV